MTLHDLSLEVPGVLLEEELDDDHNANHNVDIQHSVTDYVEANPESIIEFS